MRQSMFAIAAILGLATSAAQATALIEETVFLNATIEGKPTKLEALIVKPANASERLPVALITHGKHGDPKINAALRATDMAPQARDFAHRGWLAVAVVRRGFGRSDGPEIPLTGPKCERADYKAFFDRAANDLIAALDAVGQRPDADRSRTIAIGESAGGATVLSLAARRPQGLIAAISVAGGLALIKDERPACDFHPNLIATSAFYGAQTRIPMLWLYAANDKLFNADLVHRMHGAYNGAGGQADLQIFPPVRDDGHALWGAPEGRVHWLATLDQFLVANRLPTWDLEKFETAVQAGRIVEGLRNAVEQYLSYPSNKVLAVSKNGQYAYWRAAGEYEAMRESAIKLCEENAKETCSILFEDFNLVDDKVRTSARQGSRVE